MMMSTVLNAASTEIFDVYNLYSKRDCLMSLQRGEERGGPLGSRRKE